MVNALDLIRARRNALLSDIDVLRLRISELEIEDGRLASAEAVIAELVATNDDSEPLLARHDGKEAEVTQAFIVKGKPDGAPSMPDMIVEALETTHHLGSPGLQPTGMASYIKGRYWPEVEVVNVGPIAWRMWKRGQLGKDGPLYFLHDRKKRYPVPENEEAFDGEPTKTSMNGTNGAQHSGGAFG